MSSHKGKISFGTWLVCESIVRMTLQSQQSAHKKILDNFAIDPDPRTRNCNNWSFAYADPDRFLCMSVSVYVFILHSTSSTSSREVEHNILSPHVFLPTIRFFLTKRSVSYYCDSPCTSICI